jgi:hypothetical protein
MTTLRLYLKHPHRNSVHNGECPRIVTWNANNMMFEVRNEGGDMILRHTPDTWTLIDEYDFYYTEA